MKKLMIMTAIFSATLFYANAQDARKRPQFSPEKQAERVTERMSERLELTPEQKQEVYQLHLETAQKRQAEMKERWAKMTEERKERKEKLDNILTDEQKTKLEAIQKEAKSKRGQYKRPGRGQGDDKPQFRRRGNRQGSQG